MCAHIERLAKLMMLACVWGMCGCMYVSASWCA